MFTTKKFIIFFAVASGLALFTTLAFATTAFAAVDIGFSEEGMASQIAGDAGYDTSGGQYALSQTVGGIIRAVLSIIGVLFLGLTVFAGFLWMTAAGNDEKVTKAKSILTSAVIGLAIVAASYGITALVFTFLFQASAPASDVSSGTGEGAMGCCVKQDESKCTQTASRGACTTKWENASWYSGESCTPYITMNTGCEFQMDL